MRNKKQIEVEIRGPLSYHQLKSLTRKLRKESRFLGKKKQEVIFFQENKILHFPKDHLRIRKDKRGEKVCLKLKSGQEIEFFLKEREYKKAITFFKFFGFNHYSISPSWREDYSYQGATISLKWRCIIGPHFEIEKIVNNKNETAKTHKKLLILAGHLDLKIWSEKEYLEHKSHCWDLYKRNGRLR